MFITMDKVVEVVSCLSGREIELTLIIIAINETIMNLVVYFTRTAGSHGYVFYLRLKLATYDPTPTLRYPARKKMQRLLTTSSSVM